MSGIHGDVAGICSNVSVSMIICRLAPPPLMHACAPGGALIKHHKRVGPGYPGLGPVSHLGPPSPGTIALLTPPHGYRIPPGPPPYAAAPGTMALLVRPHKQAYDPIAVAGSTLAWHEGRSRPSGSHQGEGGTRYRGRLWRGLPVGEPPFSWTHTTTRRVVVRVHEHTFTRNPGERVIMI